MLEILNSSACLLMMLYSLPLAMTMGNRGLLVERLAIVAVQCGLFLGLTNPWASWGTPSPWTEVYLNVSAALMLTIWRRRAWIFVMNYLGPVDLTKHRRADDYQAGPTPVPQVHRWPWSETPKA